MSGKHVFLTGATGSVGGGILAALAAEGGFAVDCLVRRPEAVAAIARAGGRPVTGDMTDEGVFARLRCERDYEFIIHAAQVSYRDSTPAEIDGRERVAVRHLEMLATTATRLMVFTSGVWMYGNAARGRPINEDTPWDRSNFPGSV
jgi:nucleoside-diphosphate-sugar epimerase